MPSKFPRLKDGDELTPRVFNLIFQELERWRQMSGSGGIGVDNADGNVPPQIVDQRAPGLIPAQLTASLATGTIASPTSATMTLLALSSGGPALSTTAGITGFTVYNFWPLSSTIASGTNILVFRWAGYYYLAQVGC